MHSKNLGIKNTRKIKVRKVQTLKEFKRLKKFFPQAQKVVLDEGPLKAKLMFVGEAPGKNEDLQGRPFVGRAGRFLDKILEQVGINRKKAFITSVVKFLPAKRTPNKKEIALCLPYTLKQIKAIKPKVICLLGNVALNALLSKKMRISKVHGKKFIKEGIIYFPTFHPAAAMRNKEMARLMKRDLRKLKFVL